MDKNNNLDNFRSKCLEFESRMNEHNDGCDYSLKAYLVINIFLWHLKIFPTTQEPVVPMLKKIDEAIHILNFARDNEFSSGYYPKKAWTHSLDDRTNKGPFEKEMSSLFASLWDDMTDDIYFDESLNSTVTRFESNDIDAKELFKDKNVLDAGCGSGKFACALINLGAKKVTCIDLSESAISFAKRQAEKAGFSEKMEFQTSSVCEMPFQDNSFDFVWSNGVVHHTTDYVGAIKEFYRVLKPGGESFLYVNGRWGMLEALTDTLKNICRFVPPGFIQKYCQAVGMHTGRIYWVIDNLYAPYEWKSREEVIAILEGAGFTSIRQLTRGLENDQIEMVSRGIPYAKLKYGDGQLKFLSLKPVK